MYILAAEMEQCTAGGVQNRLCGGSTVHLMPPVAVPLQGGAQGQVLDPVVGWVVPVPNK